MTASLGEVPLSERFLQALEKNKIGVEGTMFVKHYYAIQTGSWQPNVKSISN